MMEIAVNQDCAVFSLSGALHMFLLTLLSLPIYVHCGRTRLAGDPLFQNINDTVASFNYIGHFCIQLAS